MEKELLSTPTGRCDTNNSVSISPIDNTPSTKSSPSDIKSQSSAISQSSATKRLLLQGLHIAPIGGKDDIKVVSLKKSNCCCIIC